MYVRCKVRDGRAYHYLVTTERKGGRVRQRTVAYLGDYPTVAAALAKLPDEIAELKQRVHDYVARADRARGFLGANTIKRNGGEVPRSTRRSSMSQHGRRYCNE